MLWWTRTGLGVQRVKCPRWWSTWLSRELRTQTDLELQTPNTPKACPQYHTPPKRGCALRTRVLTCPRLGYMFITQYSHGLWILLPTAWKMPVVVRLLILESCPNLVLTAWTGRSHKGAGGGLCQLRVCVGFYPWLVSEETLQPPLYENMDTPASCFVLCPTRNNSPWPARVC